MSLNVHNVERTFESVFKQINLDKKFNSFM